MADLLFENILREENNDILKDSKLKTIRRLLVKKFHSDVHNDKNKDKLFNKYCSLENVKNDDDYYELIANGVKSDLKQYSNEILPLLKAYKKEHKQLKRQKLNLNHLKDIFLHTKDKYENFKVSFFQGHQSYNAIAFDIGSKVFVVNGALKDGVYFTFVDNKKVLDQHNDLRTNQGKELQQKQIEELSLLNKNKSRVLEEINNSISFRCKNTIIEQFKNADEPKNTIDMINKCLNGTMSVYMLNKEFNNEFAKMIELTNEIQKNYAEHPYLDQVVQAMEDNMTGNKYIKVGNQAYKEAFEYYKEKVHEILKTLREADLSVSLNDIKDVTDKKIQDGVNLVDRIYRTPSNEKWEDKDFIDAVNAARDGDQTAIGFLMYKHSPMIASTYWRNFLGPDAKMRKIRIEKDGGLKSSFLGWIGICLKALVKGGVDIAKKNGGERHKFSTLEGFDENRVKGKPENAFAAHFKLDVIEQAKVYNTLDANNGVSNADGENITMTNLEFDNGRERTGGEDDAFIHDSVEDAILDKVQKDGFLKNWIDYCQDEELNDGKKCTPAAALWKLLTNPDATNLKAVAEEMGVSRGTFEALAKKAVGLLSNYSLDYSQLMNACDTYGVRKIASYLAH